MDEKKKKELLKEYSEQDLDYNEKIANGNDCDACCCGVEQAFLEVCCCGLCPGGDCFD